MEAFYEHCACIGCMMHPPARTQLVLSSLLSGSLEHSVCSNACPFQCSGAWTWLCIPVSGHLPGWHGCSVAVVVLNEFHVHAHLITDPVQGILKLKRHEEWESCIYPLLLDISLGLK